MHQFTVLRDQILPVFDNLPPEEALKARASLDRMVKSYELLDTKFNRGIRDRAAIHSLLKKTSEDLIAQYRVIFEFSGTAMIVVEHDGTISLANSKFGELTGYEPADIERKRHFVGFFSDQEQGRIWHYHKSRRHGNSDVPDQYETVLLTRHNGLRNVAITVGLLSVTGQSIIALLDITEQKQIVADLNHHRSNLEALLSLYQMEVTSLDIIGRAAVEKATILTGSTIGVLLVVPNQYNLSDTCWTYGIDHETATSLIGGPVHQAAGRATPLIENQYEVPPGLVSRYGKTMHIITVPVMEGNRVVAVIGLGGSDTPYRESFETQLTILVSTMWHLIVRREQDTAIDLANKKLNLMNEITHHDILNAVSGIFGCLDLITGPASEAERYTLLSEIRNRTTTIHGHILFTWDYQNVGVKAPRWNDVKVLVTSVAELFKTSPVDIQTEISDTEVFADPMLERVIYNLIDNALRYGEQITWIRFFLRMENHGLTIVCEDDGAGIPQEMKETIFNRGVGNNTGLGLFLTREILGITGMTIRETGEPGKGARFEITVPPEQFRSSSGSHCM